MTSTALFCLLTLSTYPFLPFLPHPLPYYARTLLTQISLLITVTYGLILAVLLRPWDASIMSMAMAGKVFCTLGTFATGIQVQVVDGEERLRMRNVVFVVNHQSELDIFVLSGVFPTWCSWAAKSDLRRVPILGWFLSVTDTLFVDFKNSTSTVDAFRKAAVSLKQGRRSVLIFPEGERSYHSEPNLLPFKKGAFHLAVQAQVPIVPIVVNNYADIAHQQSKTLSPGNVLIKVMEPIDTTNLTSADVDGLAKRTRQMMLDEVISLTAKERSIASTSETLIPEWVPWFVKDR